MQRKKLPVGIGNFEEIRKEGFNYVDKTDLILDEYDVASDKAFQHGYYEEMVSLIRGLFGQALKTNELLQG